MKVELIIPKITQDQLDFVAQKNAADGKMMIMENGESSSPPPDRYGHIDSLLLDT